MNVRGKADPDQVFDLLAGSHHVEVHGGEKLFYLAGGELGPLVAEQVPPTADDGGRVDGAEPPIECGAGNVSHWRDAEIIAR